MFRFALPVALIIVSAILAVMYHVYIEYRITQAIVRAAKKAADEDLLEQFYDIQFMSDEVRYPHVHRCHCVNYDTPCHRDVCHCSVHVTSLTNE